MKMTVLSLTAQMKQTELSEPVLLRSIWPWCTATCGEIHVLLVVVVFKC